MNNKLEALAVEIALLSNDSLQKLSNILVRDYTTRANVMEASLNTAFFDSNFDNVPEGVEYE
jgi:hypothetical protein